MPTQFSEGQSVNKDLHEAIVLLCHALPAPPQMPNLLSVARNSVICLDNCLKKRPTLLLHLRNTRDLWANLAASASEALGNGLLMTGFVSTHPAWSLFAGDDLPKNPGVQDLLGELLTAAVITAEPIANSAVRQLRTLLNKQQERVIAPAQFDLELLKLCRRSNRVLNELSELLQATKNKQFLSLNASILQTLNLRLSSARQTEREAAGGDRSFSIDELKRSVSALIQQAAAGDPDAVVTLTCACLGLGFDIGKQIPLLHQCPGDCMAWINTSAGTMHVDLTLLLNELGKQAKAGHEPSTLQLCRPLPQLLATLLQTAQRDNPSLATLGDLCIRTETSRKKISLHEAHHSASMANLMNSMRGAALHESGRRDIAAFSMLGFELLSKSDLHYICPRETEIWQCCEKVYDALDLGPAVPVPGSVVPEHRVGSRLTAKTTWIQSVFEEAARQVETTRCGRRYTAQSLVRFHNAFARYVGLFIQLTAGGRDRKEIPFSAAQWTPDSLYALQEDKVISGTRGRTPIPIPASTALQLRYWHAHLRVLERRLAKILDQEPSQTSARIRSVICLQDVPLLFKLNDAGQPTPVIAEDLFQGTAEDLNRDFGRHFLTDQLLDHGLKLDDVQAWLRHHAPGMSSHALTSSRTPFETLTRLCQGIDDVLLRLSISARHGLTKDLA
jgi:hypothetical protein